MPTPQATTPSASGYPLLAWVAWVVVVLIGAVVVFGVVFSIIPETKSKPTWVSSSGVPTPANFLYAMFPADSAVPLCDSPGGKPVAILARAVVNSQEEINAGGWVQVQEPGGPYAVQLSRLDYAPPLNASADYFAAFVSAYQARDPAGDRHARLEIQRDPSGVASARLHLRQGDHLQDYVYEVSPGRATPREMRVVFGPGEAVADIGRFILAVGAAIGFLILAGVGSIVVAMRRRAARGQNAVLQA
jgi:hypothetical protein